MIKQHLLRRIINGVITDISPPVTGNSNRGLGQFALTYEEANADSTMELCNFHYIDEPNTILQVRYDVMLISQSTCVFYYNRTVNASNTPGGERGATEMEIKSQRQTADSPRDTASKCSIQKNAP